MAGRPKKSVLDVMKTRVWLAEMLRVTGMENVNQLGELVGDVDTKKMLYRYAHGDNTVSLKMLEKIDLDVRTRKPNHKDGASFFLVGPGSPTESVKFVPLWDALAGSMEEAWNVMLAYDPTLAVQKCLSVSFGLLCSYAVVQIFGTTEPVAYWEGDEPNWVAKEYSDSRLDVDVDLITFLIAAWRMAHFVGQAQPMMDYILIGLLEKAIPEILNKKFSIEIDDGKARKRYGITDDFMQHIKALADQHLEEAGLAVKDMDYTANMYPGEEEHPVRGVRAVMEQPLDHAYLFEHLKRRSVAAFFARKQEAVAAA